MASMFRPPPALGDRATMVVLTARTGTPRIRARIEWYKSLLVFSPPTNLALG
jgi:hypothetical protein